ncbi:MAG: mechanosensitive ion channel family protein [Candidatus Nanopelagicales bacterium]
MTLFLKTSGFMAFLESLPAFILISLLVAASTDFVVGRIIKRTVSKAAKSAQRERLGSEKKNARTAELTDLLMGERREQRAESIGSLLRSFMKLMIWGTSLLVILTRLGIEIGPLLASAGVVGVALGFGAQTLVKDYLAGIFLIIEDQFGVGDVVDLGDATGTVEEIRLRTTRVRDLSGVVWYIRNGEIIRVANKSQGWTMASVELPVAYDENLERIRDLVAQVGIAMDEDPQFDDILLSKPEFAGVESVSGEAVFIRIFAKAAPQQQVALARAIRERMKLAFDEAGVKVPIIARPFQQQPPKAQ